MYSTLFLLLLVAFSLCYLTSPQLRGLKLQLVGYQAYLGQHPRGFRAAGWGLLAGTALAAALWLGPMTGLSVWLVGLMGMGGLVVALAPLGYLHAPTLATLYVLSLALELFF